MVGYPYTYGDAKEVDFIDFIHDSTYNRSVLMVCALMLIPASALAADAASAMSETALKTIPKNATTAIGPVSAVCCMGAGYCAHVAQLAKQKGNGKMATGAVCGALAFCCAQRVAQSYKL